MRRLPLKLLSAQSLSAVREFPQLLNLLALHPQLPLLLLQQLPLPLLLLLLLPLLLLPLPLPPLHLPPLPLPPLLLLPLLRLPLLLLPLLFPHGPYNPSEGTGRTAVLPLPRWLLLQVLASVPSRVPKRPMQMLLLLRGPVLVLPRR